jgi:SAM-dependent methyltransferase
MKYRGIQDMVGLARVFSQKELPYISHRHIDFGCGTGQGTAYQKKCCPKSEIVGYDPNSQKIERAKMIWGTNPEGSPRFVSSLDGCGLFNSATANWVFHEAPGIFEELRQLVVPGGALCAMEYNMKGYTLRRFKKEFCLDNELKVLQKEGLDICYPKHTRFGPEDLISEAERNGFKTKDLFTFDRFFLWAGEKPILS